MCKNKNKQTNKDNWLRLDAQGINSVPIVEEEEPQTVDET